MADELWVLGIEAADHKGLQQRHAYGPYSTRDAAEFGLTTLSAHHVTIEAATIAALEDVPADFLPLVERWRVKREELATRDLFA